MPRSLAGEGLPRFAVALAALVLTAALACESAEETPAAPNQFGGSSSGGSSSSGGGGQAVANVDVTQETFAFGGAARRYYLARPRPYDANKAYPLVMSFHGNPGKAEDIRDGLPFDSVSKNQAVIAYPSSADPGGWDIYSPTSGNADMEFVRALVDEIASKVSVDRGKVFGFGYSGGGFFVSHFACRFGGVFKAISVHAGGGPDEDQMGFAKKANGCFECPGGPTATLVTHGANDTEVEPGSGEYTALCYASTNGCQESRSASSPAPCEQYDGCPTDKPVKLCIVPGQGHAPWRDAMKESWAFFTSLP